MASKEIKQGPATLRWQPDKEHGFAGGVILPGKRPDIIYDEDEQRLIARLRNEAGKLHPHYVGFDGAIKRFLHFMPDGIHGGLNEMEERTYKANAAAALTSALTLDAAHEASDEDAKRVARCRCWTNMLSPFESMRLKDTLNGPSGAKFLRAAAQFAAGQFTAGGVGMTAAVQKHGRISWPIATYLPYLWDYEQHMFLKPTVTIDFSERVGHHFHHDYDSAINPKTYESLLDLVSATRSAISPLAPRDNIDIQSFIWVVGEYRESDKKE